MPMTKDLVTKCSSCGRTSTVRLRSKICAQARRDGFVVRIGRDSNDQVLYEDIICPCEPNVEVA